jgi:hypothetical protein
MNYQVTDGENLKNLKDIGIGVFDISGNTLPCAQTNLFVGFSYTITKDNPLPNDGASYSSVTGQCDWGTFETLTVSADSFAYVINHGSGERTLTLTIKKTGDNTYDIYRHETDPNPSWGLPADWEFHVSAVKAPIEN